MENLTLLVVIWLLFTFSCALVAESQSPPNFASPKPPPVPLATPPPPPMNHPSPPPRRVHPHRRSKHPHPPPPPPPPKKMNTGKKIGLIFAGISGVIQIGVVGLLVLQRRRLFSAGDNYENCS